jgi:hypothetical protein
MATHTIKAPGTARWAKVRAVLLHEISRGAAGELIRSRLERLGCAKGSLTTQIALTAPCPDLVPFRRSRGCGIRPLLRAKLT